MDSTTEGAFDFRAPIIFPARMPWEARPACVCPDGGESLIPTRIAGFTALNHEKAAICAASIAEAALLKLERELHSIERKLAWTAVTVGRPLPNAHLNWTTFGLVIFLTGAAGLGFFVSNVVLSQYVLRSSSDLFSNDQIGAVLFATLPWLCAVGIKLFEQRIAGANARWLYSTVVFTIGVVALMLWLVSAAILFSPDVAVTNLLSESPNNRWLGIALVLSTVICDITWGATILSGVGHLMAKKKCSETVPNPEYAELLSRRARIEKTIAKSQQRRAEAEDYLSRAAAGRELIRRQAEHDLERARELWSQFQSTAQAVAIAMFLSVEED
jgi:hypothetical protein